MKIKSIISLILALLFIIPLAACGSETVSPDVETLEEFLEKHKRADFDAFLKDPTEFLEDYKHVQTFQPVSDSDLNFLSSWTKLTGEYDDDDYEKKIVLFNKGALVHASVYDRINIAKKYCNVHFFITFDTGDASIDFEIAKALTDGMIKLYGDPDKYEVGMDEATEADIRKLFAGDPASFSVEYTSGKDFHAVSFFASPSFSRVSIY